MATNITFDEIELGDEIGPSDKIITTEQVFEFVKTFWSSKLSLVKRLLIYKLLMHCTKYNIDAFTVDTIDTLEVPVQEIENDNRVLVYTGSLG